ncbi:MAG: Vms1/Ankzf1 family peptidyl-tRNA hydrolase [Thermomicrobiales bacterium]
MAKHNIEHGGGLTTNLRARLHELAALPPVLETPYLTVSVDWSVDGENPGATFQTEGKASQRKSGHGAEGGVTRRPGRIEVAHELKKIVDAAGIRGTVYDSLKADAEAILAFLDGELDPSAQGAFIVANSGAGVFEALSIGVPTPTGAVTGPTPALSPLARLVEDYPPYLVFVGDLACASLTVVTRHRPAGNLTMKGSKYPKHQKQGGSQRRYQERAQNRIDSFVKDAAIEAEQILTDFGIDIAIVGGDEVFVSALNAGIGPKLKAAIAAKLDIEMKATDKQIIDMTMPIVEQIERDRELADAKKLAGEIGESDKGAGDIIPVLKALVAGQVSDLIFNEDFQAVGWADFTLDLYGPGDVPAEHPIGGDVADLVAIDLDEEMVRLALRGGAEIEIIEVQPPVAGGQVPKAGDAIPRTEAAAILDGFGGVGALLRYA